MYVFQLFNSALRTFLFLQSTTKRVLAGINVIITCITYLFVKFHYPNKLSTEYDVKGKNYMYVHWDFN